MAGGEAVSHLYKALGDTAARLELLGLLRLTLCDSGLGNKRLQSKSYTSVTHSRCHLQARTAGLMQSGSLQLTAGLCITRSVHRLQAALDQQHDARQAGKGQAGRQCMADGTDLLSEVV